MANMLSLCTHKTLPDGSTIIHVEMPKSSASSSKRVVTHSAETKFKRIDEHVHSSDSRSTSMTSMTPTAGITRWKLEDCGPGSVADSYPPRINLGEEYHKMSFSNGEDLIFDAASSSQEHPSSSASKCVYAFSTSGYKHPRSTVAPYTGPCHSSADVDSSPYPLNGITQSPDAYSWPASVATGFNSYGSRFLHTRNPNLSNSPPCNGLWNGVEDASSKHGYTFHGMIPASLESHNGYGFGSASMGDPRGIPIQNAFPNPLELNMQSMPQDPSPANEYVRLHHCRANLTNPAPFSIDPRKLSVDD